MKCNIKNDECHSVLKLTYITFSSDLDKLSTSLSSQLLVTTVLLTAIVPYRTPMINRSIYFIWNYSVSWVRFFLLILEYKRLLYPNKCSSLKNLDGNTVNDEYHLRDVCWKKYTWVNVHLSYTKFKHYPLKQKNGIKKKVVFYWIVYSSRLLLTSI